MNNTNWIYNYLIPETEINTTVFKISDEDTTVILPRRARYYLDEGSDEFKRISIERKLCELGVAITRGINLYTVIKEDIKNHVESKQDKSYKKNAKKALLSYIYFLRETGDVLTIENIIEFKDNKLIDLVNLLEEEIILRYHESPASAIGKVKVSFASIPVDYLSIKKSLESKSDYDIEKFKKYKLTSHESIKKAVISKEYIMSINPWLKVKDKLLGYNLFFDKELIYPGDEPYLKAYNDSHQNEPNKQLVLQVPPEPWSANILNSKLVLLSMNPGYVERLNKNLANMFRNQYAEEIMEDKRLMLGMEGVVFDLYEPTRILGEYYWRNILSRFGEELYGSEDKDKIYSQIALCQYLAYSSTEKVELKEILPSQKFTKMVLLYLITSRKDVKFLVMRSSKEWNKLLGDGIWNYLLENDRLYISEHYRTQSLSEKNIGTNYKEIVKYLKGIS